MLSSQLHATTDVLPVAGLDRLAEHLPLAWIEQALSVTGTASIRRRRLPAEQVVWLVIALAFYRHQSMPEVLATLDLALPSPTTPASNNPPAKPEAFKCEPLKAAVRGR